jgi:hypothetical protein
MNEKYPAFMGSNRKLHEKRDKNPDAISSWWTMTDATIMMKTRKE